MPKKSDQHLQNRINQLTGHVPSEQELADRIARLKNHPQQSTKHTVNPIELLKQRHSQLTQRFTAEKAQRATELNTLRTGTPEYRITANRNKRMDKLANKILNNLHEYPTQTSIDIPQKFVRNLYLAQMRDLQVKHENKWIKQSHKNIAELKALDQPVIKSVRDVLGKTPAKPSAIVTQPPAATTKTTKVLQEIDKQMKKAEKTAVIIDDLKQTAASAKQQHPANNKSKTEERSLLSSTMLGELAGALVKTVFDVGINITIPVASMAAQLVKQAITSLYHAVVGKPTPTKEQPHSKSSSHGAMTTAAAGGLDKSISNTAESDNKVSVTPTSRMK